MESYEKFLKSICRVCLVYNNSGKMVDLLDNTSENGVSCYGKAVSTFADILINADDKLPSMMCESCLHLLKQAIGFKFKCESTQKRLQLITKYKPPNELSNPKNTEKVVEYTLFTHYFPNMFTEKLSTKSTSSVCEEKSANFDEINKENSVIAPVVCKDFPTDNNHDYLDDVPLKFLNKNHCTMPQNVDSILDVIEKIIERDSKKERSSETICRKKIFKHRVKLKPKGNLYKIKLRKKVDQSEIVCKICNKMLANKSTYAYHMQRHNGCRFICEHCAKGFPVLSELQIHLVSQHGLGPYLQCSHCPFKAPRKFDLIEHERIHTGERPYTCEKCGLTFRRRGIWKKHLIHHNEKSIQCPICPRKFYQRSDMIAHKNNVHERLYVYLCSKCGTTYAKTDTVRKHMMERHGIPKELQGKITRINKGRETGFPAS